MVVLRNMPVAVEVLRLARLAAWSYVSCPSQAMPSGGDLRGCFGADCLAMTLSGSIPMPMRATIHPKGLRGRMLRIRHRGSVGRVGIGCEQD
ncbi:MAG: hypothetical protein ACI8PT_000074 [Gammaproteobacteria bacterium]|jgi:hypothetical protein